MNAKSSPLTTHVLNTGIGAPAQGLSLSLHRLKEDSSWEFVNSGTTNQDGRLENGLLTQEQFTVGMYKMHFSTGEYFKKLNQVTFYPYVEVVFEIKDPSQHYHVPLLLSAFGYSTYRGS